MTRSLTVLAITALVASSCAASDPVASNSGVAPNATTGKIDREAAIAAAIDVRVSGCGPRVGFGTGSVIAGGDIVTAAHVVAGATEVEVIDVDGERSDAAVILIDPDLDFAVLRPTDPVGLPIQVRPDDARSGEVGVVVLPRLVDGAVTVEVADVRVVRAVNITTTDIYLDGEVIRPGYEIEGSIDPGDSGALVVLPGGGAGIVWARSNRNEQRAWAIDLPADVRYGSALSGEQEPVDVGACTAPRPG